jgi:Ca2+-binding RTX toxin-like protein
MMSMHCDSVFDLRFSSGIFAMPQSIAQARVPIIVELLDGKALNVFATQLWYLPSWSTLRYNNQNTDWTDYSKPQPRYDLTKDGTAPLSGRLFIGGNGADTASGDGANIFIGGAGNDELGLMTKPGPFLGNILSGGSGADLFHIYYDPKTGVINNEITDLKVEDSVVFHFRAGNALSTAAFAEEVKILASLYRETRNLIFDVTPNGPSFSGSAYNDIITIGGSSTFVTAVAAGDGNDIIVGSGRAEDLRGGNGNDFIDGSGGRDTLFGGVGADTIAFYAGDSIGAADRNDTIIIKSEGITLGAEYGRILYDISSSMNRAILRGGLLNDTISGSAAQQSLNGGDGDDTIFISGTNTTANGGAGNDTIVQYGSNALLIGGAGVDVFYVSSTSFTIQDLQRGERVIAIMSSNAMSTKLTGLQNNGAAVSYNINLGLDVVGATLNGFNGADIIFGTSLVDSIQGLAGHDSITGGAGNDTLSGGDGNDTLIGGTGLDSLIGGAGDDWIEGSAGTDTLLGEAGNDTLIGSFGADRLNGGAGNDLLIGLDGNDVLEGGAGNDTLVGALGADSLTGGTGLDVFVFNPTNEAYLATITDFVSGQDKIDLSGFTLAGFSRTSIANRLIYNATSKLLSADFNGDGFVDVNVALTTGTFNKATDLVVNTL